MQGTLNVISGFYNNNFCFLGLWKVSDCQRVCGDAGLQHRARHALSGKSKLLLESRYLHLSSMKIEHVHVMQECVNSKLRAELFTLKAVKWSEMDVSVTISSSLNCIVKGFYSSSHFHTFIVLYLYAGQSISTVYTKREVEWMHTRI